LVLLLTVFQVPSRKSARRFLSGVGMTVVSDMDVFLQREEINESRQRNYRGLWAGRPRKMDGEVTNLKNAGVAEEVTDTGRFPTLAAW
jgi:hypothetical protein